MTKKSLFVCLLAAGLLWAGSCKKTSTPTGPTSPVVTYKITITCSSNILKIGIAEQFAANYVGSDGSTAPITSGAWGGDNTAVATVTPSGQVNIVGAGMVTIFVDYKGIRGTILIQGLPDYQGTWRGSFYVKECKATENIEKANYCGNWGINSVHQTSLVLTQNILSVQGTGTVNNINFTVSGTIGEEGGVTLASLPGPIVAEIRLVFWMLKSSAPGVCSGQVIEALTKPPAPGEGGMVGIIQALTRTAAF